MCSFVVEFVFVKGVNLSELFEADHALLSCHGGRQKLLMKSDIDAL